MGPGDGQGNTEAPADDPGWLHVGASGGVSGIYLGRGWVLTAAHAPSAVFELHGERYRPLAGSSRWLRNPDHSRADLRVFRIGKDPGLPPLAIIASTPERGREVLMIGHGRNRGAAIPRVYTPGGDLSRGILGWEWARGTRLRWGTNRVNESGAQIRAAGTVTYTLSTVFDLEAGTAQEAQATPGDSGGAIFLKDQDRWLLAGVMLVVSSMSGSDSSHYGDRTLAADLARYRDQILQVTGLAPE